MMALVITRKLGQAFTISDGIREITIWVTRIDGDRQVRLAIEAPRDMKIDRIEGVPHGHAEQNP
jgi:carbon storage regulator CsrA